MATDSIPAKIPAPSRSISTPTVWDGVKLVLKPLASLRLTVVLFALGAILVWLGTLAQDKEEIWKVVEDYFRSFYVKVPVTVLFPRTWFPNLQDLKGWFPFPGGYALGWALMINLAAAHLVRFKIQAKETRLWIGLFTLCVGILITAVVILSGHNPDGLQGKPPISSGAMWAIMQGFVVACAGGAITVAVIWFQRLSGERIWERVFLILGCLFLTALAVYAVGFAKKFDDSSMRILWWLALATFASCVLLAGCILTFKKRAGIVLLHAGVGLMMVNEVIVGKYNTEESMQIVEGETINYGQDVRAVELAVIDTSPADHDDVVVVPVLRASKLSSFAQEGELLSDERLPFDLKMLDVYVNSSDIRSLKDGEETLANAGIGTSVTVDEVAEISGAQTGGMVNIASAFVDIIDRESGKSIGKYLVTQNAMNRPEKVTVGDKTYDLFLRFKRSYKPYSILLNDVSKDDYIGTETARSFASKITLTDADKGIEIDKRIWMNNPLRYAGETFYQSGYQQDPRSGVEITTLQVVANRGWMIPYVACMIVVVGMLAHFVLTILRFLQRLSTNTELQKPGFMELWSPPTRRATAATPEVAAATRTAKVSASKPVEEEKPEQKSWPLWVKLGLPILTVLLCLGYIGRRSKVPATPAGEMDLYAFGELPVAFDGRVKPFDSLARNHLRVISERETFEDNDGNRQPAIRWLLDSITKPETAFEYKVFRVVNLDVLDLLQLEPRHGYRYSLAEIFPVNNGSDNADEDEAEKVADATTNKRDGEKILKEYLKQVKAAREEAPENLTLYQKKLVDLDKRMSMYRRMVSSLVLPPTTNLSMDQIRARSLMGALETPVYRIPQVDDIEVNPRQVLENLAKIEGDAAAFEERMRGMKAPLAVPLREDDAAINEKSEEEGWQTLAASVGVEIKEKFVEEVSKKIEEVEDRKSKASESLEFLRSILMAYVDGKVDSFNATTNKYQAWLAEAPPKEYSQDKVKFESWFNAVAPFLTCSILYIMVFVISFLGLLAWLVGWQRPVQSVAFWMTVSIFAVHTAALIGRIIISGRPPVTNLYSSAIFIGWAIVVLGMLLEVIFRMGIGNIVASAAGFSTLLIAHYLAVGEGDTFNVLVAVLDTQFWLTTHVICVSLGYATTFAAGLLGIIYVILGMTTPLLRERVGQWTMGRIMSLAIYGTICFAIFFSFFGTVLGGLWADDSWGRFWGWDPKENGALIIVIWNALILHARWSGMVRDRGLAVLAILGNVVTAWSWFGVNQLGIGLHSYGFTEGVLRALAIFVASQLLLVIIGMLPKACWWSLREAPKDDDVVQADLV